jgi:ADP-ribose pyrophosphatase
LDRVSLPNGRILQREVIEHRGAVAVIALLDSSNMLAIRHFRHPVRETLIELPAGKLRKGEDPKSCARRELLEETGFRARKLSELLRFYASPGYTQELIHVFLAQGLKKDHAKREEDELVDVLCLSLTDAIEMIKRKQIRDGKSICAILFFDKLMDSSLRKRPPGLSS